MESNKEMYRDIREKLDQDIMENERFRSLLLAIIAGVLFLTIFLVVLVNQERLSDFLENTTVVYVAMMILVLLGARALVIRFVIGRLQKKGKVLPKFSGYINTFIEVSIPSIGILAFGYYVSPSIATLAPTVFTYFLFIMLSTFELDAKLSFFAGFVAAAEYSVLSFLFANELQEVPDYVSQFSIIDMEIFFFGKSIILLLAGIVAGLISSQIKKRIIKLYLTQEERNQLEKSFGQQVSSTIVDELVRGNFTVKSRKRFVCMMFLDIEGFTPFCENRSPEEIVAYQNAVFSVMIDAVNNNFGIINQFMGDGFMATFGAPITTENDCQNAVNSALEIVGEMKRRSAEGLIPETKVRIGMHSGDVVTGNVGTAIRKQYSVTGNTVILAARMEQLNKRYGSSILISKEVFDRINTTDLEYEHIGLVDVKGRKQPMDVYKLA